MINIEISFDDVYARYYLAIVRYAIARGFPKETAEEIAQETFERLWRRRTECMFENEAALRVWLYKVAGLVGQEQRRTNMEAVDITVCENYLSDTDEIGERDEQIQYEQYIAEIEKELSETERMLFRQILIEKKSYAACAGELRMNPVTVRSSISRLREELRPFIAEMLAKTK